MRVEPLFNLLPSHWEVVTLGEACRRGGGDVQTGPFGSQLHASDYVPVGIPSIMPKNIGENRVDITNIARITPEDAKRLSRYLVKPGDIVYSRRGDVERRALIRKEEEGWFCGTGCLRIRSGKGIVDPRYASYYLGHLSVRDWIVRHAIGATMPNLNTSILSSLPFVLPPLDEQKAIAHILGTLDDKIELNQQMNQTLEAIARALFKSWFIDFDPVRAKMDGRQPAGMDPETAALFPDDFKDGGAIGKIPAGWRSGVLKDIFENPKRTIRPEQIPVGTPYVGLEHMPKRSIALSDWGVSDNVESNKFQFENGDILFGKLRPYFHKVGVAIQNGVCSTDILVIIPKCSEWFSLALAYVSSDGFVEYTNMSSDGTRMPRTNWQVMGQYPITIPSLEVAKAFNTEVSVIVQTIRSNIFQLKTLASIRDTLLPKLLSGEICVKDAEKVVEAVV